MGLLGLLGFGGGVSNYLMGGGTKNSGVSASGGTTNPYTDPDGVSWTSHKWTGPGNFVVSAVTGTGEVEYLVVGGGGGGAGSTPWAGAGGGGGAGGLRTNVTDHPLAGDPFVVSASPGTYPVTVGSGGAHSNAGPKPPHDPPHGASPGSDGGPSTFGPITE